ncbi:MAG: hypothetical protein A3D39_00535 [Candidatus Buchananbacteria bacterium RIFCSPHIGHO2_02_FULL_39_17]|uniref:Uncharacterized protein n=1 Tax=Candidatus Buchananbacteria bacterium RIFCSPLOWO2_01_FULL_40_23b TaxID=1797544 RepID=A0A1G1YLJ9_9BACT|nr:MAG: hypothetical protein A3D39_00535 [Candidatus Buchananbacteria bacterium RIFCSPHIGHO2_02_FULL_39_17]OGY53151.1 MAG: hypothetical protein A2912_04215 [Candidatus Buchananbacteria bacterium RIFCSPLOWO2_01_FULL_40_23b]
MVTITDFKVGEYCANVGFDDGRRLLVRVYGHTNTIEGVILMDGDQAVATAYIAADWGEHGSPIGEFCSETLPIKELREYWGAAMEYSRGKHEEARARHAVSSHRDIKLDNIVGAQGDLYCKLHELEEQRGGVYYLTQRKQALKGRDLEIRIKRYTVLDEQAGEN